jgi:hypothetical protein
VRSWLRGRHAAAPSMVYYALSPESFGLPRDG